MPDSDTPNGLDDVRFVDDYSDQNSDDNINMMMVDDNQDEDDDDLLLDEDDNEDISDSEIHPSRLMREHLFDEDDEDLHSHDIEDDEGDNNSSADNDSELEDAFSGLRNRSAAGERTAQTLMSLFPGLRERPGRAGGDLNIGAMLGEALGGSINDSGYGRILRQLRSPEDGAIMSGLSELSEMFLMPHTGFGFPVMPLESISKALVSVLKHTSNVEIQVMAARAIAQMLDNGMGPGTVRALVGAGLVPVMKQLFENVFYIDLIEQLIHVVKPVASVEPKLMLVSGCLNPCVATLDFFNEHIQRQTMVAVESCTKAVNQETFESARDLLAIFPETPSPLVLGTYCLLLISIARCGKISEFVSERTWNNLVASIQSGTPHVSRVMRAAAHVAAVCPQYVTDAEALANTVVSTLVPTHESTTDFFNRLISVHKDDLFGGLKLLQVLLPLPSPVGAFSGPYRRNQHEKLPKIADIVGFSRTVAPLAIAAYSATTSSQVRQLAILVVLQLASALKKDAPDQFKNLIHELGLLNFAVQILAEGGDNLSLTVGGLDIIWELSRDDTLVDIRNSGVGGDLDQYLPIGFPDRMPQHPSGHFGPLSDLTSVCNYMTAIIVLDLTKEKGFSIEQAYEVTEKLRNGDFNIVELRTVPVANLIRADFFEVLNSKDVEYYLCEEIVSLLQSAVSRLEKFPLELTGSRATSLEDVMSRAVYLRIMDRHNMLSDRAWTATVPILATLESVEEFVRARLIASSLNRDGGNPLSGKKIRFYSGDTRLPHDISIMKAIGPRTDGMDVITFELVDEDENDDEDEDGNERTQEVIPKQLKTVLDIMKRLALENETSGDTVPWSLFRSSKLAAKLSRQLADILAVSTSMLPQWTFDTVHQYPFLYPLEIRLHFVQLTSFGMGRNLRLLRRMQQENDDGEDDALSQEIDESSRILGRHKRQKFRLARDNLLEGGLRLLEYSSKSPAIIEVMFNNEEGTGRGPTQEFFALTSRALSNSDLGIWDFTASGLFPKPDMSPSPEVLRYFRGMGVLVSRALLDKRILDFQLNPAFFEAVLSETGPSVAKVRKVDAQLAASLDKLLDTSPKDINAMGLDFTVPGSSDELLPGGSDIEVTGENVGDYVGLVCDRIVGSGIEQQIGAFVNGFSCTLPVSALSSFMISELATLCGADRAEDWTVPTLRSALSFQHGYNVDSRAVRYLMNVLSKFSPAERRKFLVFITGSPHLPVGGFKALYPPLTVVVKPPDDEDLQSDQYLPSVMTCVNYFKLPDYSSESVLYQQLITAMSEGSGSFPLS